MTPAELYDRMYSERPENDMSLEEATLFDVARQRLSNGSSIIDIGCGAGNIALRLKEMGFQVTGVDHSPVAASLAAENGIDCRVVDVDKQDLPFAENSCDAAWAGDVIEHVFDPIGLLRKVRCVLKPGGFVFISVPNELPLRTRCRILLNGKSIHSYVYGRFEIDHHHTHFTQDLVELVIRKAGLRQISLGGVLRLPFAASERFSYSRPLSRWFGRAFVCIAQK